MQDDCVLYGVYISFKTRDNQLPHTMTLSERAEVSGHCQPVHAAAHLIINKNTTFCSH